MTNLAYAEGRIRAEEDFGVRTAAHAMQHAIPHGDMNVAAERLAKHLTDMDPGISPERDKRRERFGNPVRWGGVSSPWSGGSPTYDYSGIGRDGAAI
jgi:hypothetical protein